MASAEGVGPGVDGGVVSGGSGLWWTYRFAAGSNFQVPSQRADGDGRGVDLAAGVERGACDAGYGGWGLLYGAGAYGAPSPPAGGMAAGIWAGAG